MLMATLLRRLDQVSNKKREIFNSYYDQLFANNEQLCSRDTLNLIYSFESIGEAYRKYRKKATTSFFIKRIASEVIYYNVIIFTP